MEPFNPFVALIETVIVGIQIQNIMLYIEEGQFKSKNTNPQIHQCIYTIQTLCQVHLNQWNHLSVYRHDWGVWLQLNGGKQEEGRSKVMMMMMMTMMMIMVVVMIMNGGGP